MDLASLVSKLTAIAKRKRCEAKSPGPSFSASPMRSASSPARSPSPYHFSGQDMRVEMVAGSGVDGVQRSSKSRSWKPLLSSIRERSFNRRSESDLQKEHSEMGN